MSGTIIQPNGDVTAVTASDGRVTLSMPIRMKRRSGRTLMTLPTGETRPARAWDIAPTPLQMALARGHRWLRLLESGAVRSMRELECNHPI